MEKLNEYLQTLLSSCSDELHLEPDKNPYLVSQDSTTDVANIPMQGTQISTLVFPLIPPDVKSSLPHQPEIEFVHSHKLGNFNFNVQKSPSGFNVTIRPLLSDSGGSIQIPDALPSTAPDYAAELETQYSSPATDPEPASYNLESSSVGGERTAADSFDTTTVSDLIHEERVAAPEYLPSDDSPKIDVVSVNDPAYQTVFSDTAPELPVRRRDDFVASEDIPLQTNDGPPEPSAELSAAENLTEPEPIPAFSPATTEHQATTANFAETTQMDVLFNKMAELGASDLHLSVSMPPMVRKDGKMKPLEDGEQAISPDAMRELLTSIMPPKNQEEFAMRHDTDFAYEIPGLARFRCNVFMDRKGMGAVFRIIPSKMTTVEQLGLSKAIIDLCALSKGLVVVTGPTGSGKSTTLCAMVNHINLNRADHIITIEDPIEFVHDNHKCLVNQREVHNHTDSFKDALRAALREDPDILLVGEMRDLETISIAIETAETGHLVFGTLHTTTAASTVDRIIDQFPADRQQQIRVMLSESLKGVIAQTLLPKKGGGRVAALEVLIITPAISNLIREGKVFQIPSAMQTGKNLGMVMLNDALYEHVQNGTVEPRDAYMKAVDKTAFETMLTRGGFKL